MKKVRLFSIILSIFIVSLTYADEVDDLLSKIDSLSKQIQELKESEPRVTLKAMNMPLGQVLDSIEKGAGEPVVIDEGIDLSKEISVQMDNMPVSAALNKVLTPNGLRWRYEDGSFFVYEFEDRSWTLPLPPAVSSFQNVISNEAQSGSTGGTTTGPYGGMYGAATGTSGTTTGAKVSHKIDYSPDKFWKTLEDNIKRMISKAGSYSIDPMAGVIHVRDLAKNIKEIDTYLKNIDSELRKKVVIEVKVVEVNLKKGHEVGVDWNFIKREVFPNTTISSSSTTATDNLGSAISFVINTSLWKENFMGMLKILEDYGDVNIISQPTLLMGNNESAMIMAGQMTTYIANVSKTTTGTTGTESFSVSTGTVQDGVSLSIVARILEDSVFLNVTPVISSILQIRRIEMGDTIIEAPDTMTRSMNTSAEVKNGESLFIGGLMINSHKKNKEGLPFLSRIPILGGLFGYEKASTSKSDIAVIVTPKILTTVASR